MVTLKLDRFGTGLRYPTLYDYFYGTNGDKRRTFTEKSKSIDFGFETNLNKIDIDLILSLYKIEYEDALEGWQSNSWTIKNTSAKIE